MSEAVRVFCSYSQRDREFRETLDLHIKVLQRNGTIRSWSDRDIAPGSEWKEQIDRNLEQADLILLLISANFTGSDYCYEIEMMRALERHDRGEARVIPIILKPTDWHHTPFGKLQALPDQGRAITLWPNQDEAWANVARRIRQVAQELRGPRPAATPAAVSPAVAQPAASPVAAQPIAAPQPPAHPVSGPAATSGGGPSTGVTPAPPWKPLLAAGGVLLLALSVVVFRCSPESTPQADLARPKAPAADVPAQPPAPAAALSDSDLCAAALANVPRCGLHHDSSVPNCMTSPYALPCLRRIDVSDCTALSQCAIVNACQGIAAQGSLTCAQVLACQVRAGGIPDRVCSCMQQLDPARALYLLAFNSCATGTCRMNLDCINRRCQSELAACQLH